MPLRNASKLIKIYETIALTSCECKRVNNSLRLLALEENWILCAIVIAVNAIWHSGMLLIVRNVLTVLCMLSLYIRVERARYNCRSLNLTTTASIDVTASRRLRRCERYRPHSCAGDNKPIFDLRVPNPDQGRGRAIGGIQKHPRAVRRLLSSEQAPKDRGQHIEEAGKSAAISTRRQGARKIWICVGVARPQSSWQSERGLKRRYSTRSAQDKTHSHCR